MERWGRSAERTFSPGETRATRYDRATDPFRSSGAEDGDSSKRDTARTLELHRLGVAFDDNRVNPTRRDAVGHPRPRAEVALTRTPAQRSGGRYALWLCIGGGQGMAAILNAYSSAPAPRILA